MPDQKVFLMENGAEFKIEVSKDQATVLIDTTGKEIFQTWLSDWKKGEPLLRKIWQRNSSTVKLVSR